MEREESSHRAKRPRLLLKVADAIKLLLDDEESAQSDSNFSDFDLDDDDRLHSLGTHSNESQQSRHSEKNIEEVAYGTIADTEPQEASNVPILMNIDVQEGNQQSSLTEKFDEEDTPDPYDGTEPQDTRNASILIDTYNVLSDASPLESSTPSISRDQSLCDSETESVDTDDSTVKYASDESNNSLDDDSASTSQINLPDTDNQDQDRSRARNRQPRPDLWQKTIRKLARLDGSQYHCSGRDKTIIVDERKMGLTCTSSFCQNSKRRHCSTFDEERRKAIFTEFWKMRSWDERYTYVKTVVKKVTKKQVQSESQGRESSYEWNLLSDEGEQKQVCRKMFASTLGVSERTLCSWLIKGTEDKVPVSTVGPEVTNPRTIKNRLEEADKKFLDEWLLAIPTVPSHYCRKQPSYEAKRFIHEGRSQRLLYTDYTKSCQEKGLNAVGWKYFNGAFHRLNLSVFIPKKDQCDVCVGFKHGNITQDIYEHHVARKSKAQEMKAADKVTSENISVWTMDLESVLMCPKTKASAMYYRTKLVVHNMTYFNLKTKEGLCYVFDETNGDLSSKMFGYLHYNHFSRYLNANPDVSKVVIWSDGCGYQNKCTAITNSLLQLAIESKVPIEQKFLTPGHTQMECDSMHSLIERRIKCDIFTPREYMLAMEMARETPSAYKVTEVQFSDVKKLSGAYVKCVRPGKKVGDPTVSDVCAYRYSLNDFGAPQIFYKLDWMDEWHELPTRLSADRNHWISLFTERLAITKRKFQDLQAMKSVMPESVHHFFDSLPNK